MRETVPFGQLDARPTRPQRADGHTQHAGLLAVDGQGLPRIDPAPRLAVLFDGVPSLDRERRRNMKGTAKRA